jgi:hypothetical protein
MSKRGNELRKLMQIPPPADERRRSSPVHLSKPRLSDS